MPTAQSTSAIWSVALPENTRRPVDGTPWAPETTLKLAEALRATDRATQACGALTEFTRRYAETATAAQKTRATQLRTRASCS